MINWYFTLIFHVSLLNKLTDFWSNFICEGTYLYIFMIVQFPKGNSTVWMWNGLPVEDARIEGRALISSCKSTKITTSSWTTIDRRTLGPTERIYPTSKDKEEASEMVGGTITIKSNLTPDRWVAHQLENHNAKEVPALLLSFWTPS